MSAATTLGRYRMRRRLGSGAFATVHAAVDEVLDTPVAIKMLHREWSGDPEVRERFVQEARLLRRVEHPAFVRVFDIGETPDGRAWFAMTLAGRGTLADRLDSRGGSGAWTTADLELIIDTLASGLMALSRSDVVHRDITPRNLLIDSGAEPTTGRRIFDRDDRLLIADLGLAKDLSTGADTLTMLGGTPRFQAPEQVTPMASVDHRADVFAASAVLWEVVTGAPPPTAAELRTRLTELTAPWHAAMARGLAPTPGERYPSIQVWAEAFRSLLDRHEPVLAPPLEDDVINPYPGLRAFDERRAAFYSGRESLVDEVLGRLRNERALIVGGPSGAGKSSLLRAGLIAPLGAGGLDPSLQWAVVVMTPGVDPVRRMATATGLRVAADGSLGEEPARPMVLLIDQFEETMTLCEDDEERARFVVALRELAEIGTHSRVVLAIRSDFYGPLGTDGWLAGLIARHVFVGPMSRADLRRAVERPALRAGVPVDAALVEAIVDEAGGSAGALPHLSHALAAAWNRRDGGPLSLDDYRAVGGVAGALATTADAAVARCAPADRPVLRRLLLRLVVPGRGRQPDVRGAVPLAELSPAQQDMVGQLAGDRLLTVTEDGVQLAHEALLSSWGQLRAWLAESRADLLTGAEFRQAVRLWEERDRDPDQLIRGTVLAQVERWIDRADPELLPDEVEFVARSSQRQRRSRNLRRFVVASLVLLVAVSVIAAGIATRQSDRANAASRTALARRLASESENALLRSDVPLAALLAATGDHVSSTVETRGALLQSLVSDVDASIVLVGHEADVRALAVGPDGTTVTGDTEGWLRVWTPGGDQAAARQGHAGEVFGLAMADAGDSVVSVGSDGRVIHWAVDGLTPIASHRLDRPGERAGAGSGGGDGSGGGRSGGGPGGNRGGEATGGTPGSDGPATRLRSIATSSLDDMAIGGEGGVWLWTGTEKPPSLLFDHPVEIRAVAWHPDGTSIVAADRRGAVFIIDRNGTLLADHPDPHSDVAHGVTWTVDGEAVISVGRDRSMRRWEPGRNVVVAVPDAHDGEVYSITAAADGGRFATAGADGLVRLWSAPALQIEATLTGHQGDVRAVAFDGSRILSAGIDDTVRRWVSGRSGAVDVLLESDAGAGVLDLDGSTDGAVTVAATRTGHVMWWLDGPEAEPIAIDAHDDRIVSVRLLADGSAISGGVDGGLVISTSNGSIHRVAELDSGIASVAIVDEANMAVVGSDSGAVFAVDLLAGSSSVVLDLGAQVDSMERVAGTTALVAGTQDGRIIRIEYGDEGWASHEVGRLEGEVQAIAADPLGELVAVAGASPAITLYNTGSWTAERMLAGHTADVRDLDWSSDGAFLVSVSRDQTVKLWNRDGSAIGTARVHAADNRAVHVGLGDFVTTADNTGETVRWPGPSRWIEAGCTVAGRSLTRDEWIVHADPDLRPVTVCAGDG